MRLEGPVDLRADALGRDALLLLAFDVALCQSLLVPCEVLQNVGEQQVKPAGFLLGRTPSLVGGDGTEATPLAEQLVARTDVFQIPIPLPLGGCGVGIVRPELHAVRRTVLAGVASLELLLVDVIEDRLRVAPADQFGGDQGALSPDDRGIRREVDGRTRSQFIEGAAKELLEGRNVVDRGDVVVGIKDGCDGLRYLPLEHGCEYAVLDLVEFEVSKPPPLRFVCEQGVELIPARRELAGRDAFGASVVEVADLNPYLTAHLSAAEDLDLGCWEVAGLAIGPALTGVRHVVGRHAPSVPAEVADVEDGSRTRINGRR